MSDPKRVLTSKRPNKFVRVITESEELQKLQDNIHDAVSGLDKNPLLQNKILEEITISSTSPAVIQHGLGQRPRGWNIIDRDSDARVWRVAWDERQITLAASGDVTVSIMVY